MVCWNNSKSQKHNRQFWNLFLNYNNKLEASILEKEISYLPASQALEVSLEFDKPYSVHWPEILMKMALRSISREMFET